MHGSVCTFTKPGLAFGGRKKLAFTLHLPCATARRYDIKACVSSLQFLPTPLNCCTALTRGAMKDGAFFTISTCMLSSWVCWRLKATCAAMTRCLSAISVHWAQLQSLHLQNLLWPFNHDTTPWFRHRAHFGTRGCFRSEKDCWSTNEVSAIAHQRTLENLLKLKGCRRAVHSTLSVGVLLNKARMNDGWLLFNLYFYIQKIQEPLFTSATIGPASK